MADAWVAAMAPQKLRPGSGSAVRQRRAGRAAVAGAPDRRHRDQLGRPRKREALWMRPSVAWRGGGGGAGRGRGRVVPGRQRAPPPVAPATTPAEASRCRSAIVRFVRHTARCRRHRSLRDQFGGPQRDQFGGRQGDQFGGLHMDQLPGLVTVPPSVAARPNCAR